MKKRAKYDMSLYQKRYRCDPLVKEIEDVDITSLLDILVILLVFLLKSYNASSLKVDLVKNIDLVTSESRELGQFAPVVQVTENYNMYINNNFIININDASFSQTFSRELKEIRLKEKEKIVDIEKIKKLNNINIVLDQKLKFATVNKIMSVASFYNYENYKFIVKGNYSE